MCDGDCVNGIGTGHILSASEVQRTSTLQYMYTGSVFPQTLSGDGDQHIV